MALRTTELDENGSTAPVAEDRCNTGTHSGCVWLRTREEPIIGCGNLLRQEYVARERDYRSERPTPVCGKGDDRSKQFMA